MFKTNDLSLALWKKAIKDSNYYLIANIGSRFVGFLALPFVARMLPVEEFGKYDIFILVSSFISLFLTLGIDSGIAIFIAEKRKDKHILSSLYTFEQVITITLFLLLLGTFIACYPFLTSSNSFIKEYPLDFWLKTGIYALLITIIYNGFNFLRYLEKACIASLNNFISSFLGVILGLLLLFYYSRKEVNYFINGMLMGNLLGLCITLIFTKKYITTNFFKNNKKLFKELLWVSIPFLPNYLSNRFMQMVDRIVILSLFTSYELGLYAGIMRIAVIPMVILGSVAAGFLPVMYNNYQSKEGRRFIANVFHFYLFFLLLSVAVVSVLDKYLVQLIIGEKFIKVSHLLPVALAAFMLINCSQLSGFGYSIKRRTMYIFPITLGAISINFIASFLLAKFIGLSGVALGTLIAGVFRSSIYIYGSERLYRFGYSWKFFWGIVALVLFFSLVTQKILCFIYK